MKVDGVQIAGSAAQDAASDWEAVRRSADIQFSPLPPVKPPSEPPGWLQELGRLIDWLFAPIGRFLGTSAPVIEKVLIVLAVLLLLYLAWRLIKPWIDARRAAGAAGEPEWAPDQTEALALLEDADRLAAEGRFGEAAHLLLQRSVGQIRQARPDWLIPATTAREIAVLPMLPERARSAFSAISVRVERSLFAMRDLDAEDWRAARAAYSDFALARIEA